MVVVGIGGGIAMLVGYLLVLIGPLFCLAVPAESGSKGFIIGSVVCTLASLAPLATTWLGIRFTPFDSSASSVISTLGAILFMLFLRKLSLYIGRPDLARRAMAVLISAIVICVLLIGSALFVLGVRASSAVPGGAAAGGAAGAGVLMLVLMIAALVVFILYANLVNSLRKALRP